VEKQNGDQGIQVAEAVYGEISPKIWWESRCEKRVDE
jgi:hypothetical protein